MEKVSPPKRPKEPRNHGVTGEPVGRPTMYDPKYCEDILAHAEDGASITSFAASIRVSRRTITLWTTVHPDFYEAAQIAKALLAAWWEKQGRSIASGTSTGNAQMVQFGLKNVAPEDWQDKSVLVTDNVHKHDFASLDDLYASFPSDDAAK